MGPRGRAREAVVHIHVLQNTSKHEECRRGGASGGPMAEADASGSIDVTTAVISAAVKLAAPKRPAGDSVNIKVAVRVRPLSEAEGSYTVRATDSEVMLVHPQTGQRSAFAFDHCYGPPRPRPPAHRA